MEEMKRSVQQFVLGINADKMPTGMMAKDRCPVKAKMYTAGRPQYIPERPATRSATAPRALKILKKDVDKYDPAPG